MLSKQFFYPQVSLAFRLGFRRSAVLGLFYAYICLFSLDIWNFNPFYDPQIVKATNTKVGNNDNVKNHANWMVNNMAFLILTRER